MKRKRWLLPFYHFLFNPAYYKKQYPEVTESGLTPWEHFATKGFSLGYKYRERASLRARYHKLCFRSRISNFLENISNPQVDSQAKIAVVLHLFYMDAWQEIQIYLAALKGCQVDLFVTYCDELKNEKILNEIKLQYPNARLFACPNRGFDMGPFFEVLGFLNLDAYDIVYKLHTKGIGTRHNFIYNQVFRYRDWYENLWNGLFGYKRTHRVIKLLTSKNNNVGLVAANNLIVKDPGYKRSFIEKYCRELNLELPEEYLFVAGACFAIRASLLKPIQALHLKIENFEITRRGSFSLAHAMERIVCSMVVKQNFKLEGIEVHHNTHPFDLKQEQKYSALRLLADDRFILDDEFVFRYLDGVRIKSYSVEKIKLKEIRRELNGELLPLQDCHPYKFLLGGNVEEYQSYCGLALEQSGLTITMNRFEQLIENLNKEFNPKMMPVIDQNNVILDGQHRSCFLLHKYGEDYEVTVLKLVFKKGSLYS